MYIVAFLHLTNILLNFYLVTKTIVFGLTIPAIITMQLDSSNDEPPTIGMEARKLRARLIKIIEYE